MSEGIDLSSKMRSYAVMATEVIAAMPSNAKEVRTIYKESEQLFIGFAKAHQSGDVLDRDGIGRFLQIGVEILAWHDTMSMMQRANIPTG